MKPTIPSRSLQSTVPSCPFCTTLTRVGVHSKAERRYRCHTCNKTFTETYGTPLHHLKSDTALVALVLTLLAYGCPTQAIVYAYDLDERTVGDWLRRAGQHGKAVQEALLCQERLDLGQVQADELCVRVRGGHVWLATVMTVASRMLLWGAVSRTRDTALIGSVVAQVRRMTRLQSPLLWATDGLGTWATQIGRVFREKVMTGRRGRPRLLPWAELHVTQVVKRFGKGRVGRVERRLACGDLFEALKVIRETQGTWGTFNTAYVERLNATLRTWIPALTRRSRHAGTEESVEAGFFWVSVVYNFTRCHPSLMQRHLVSGERLDRTPAMALGLTDRRWTVEEVVRYRLPPPHTALHAVV